MLIRLDASDTQLYIYFSFFMTLTMLWQLWLVDNCDTSDFVLKDGQQHRKIVKFFFTTWDFTKTFISVRYVYCILWKLNIHMLFVWITCVLQSRRNGSWRFWLRKWRCLFQLKNRDNCNLEGRWILQKCSWKLCWIIWLFHTRWKQMPKKLFPFLVFSFVSI